MDSESIIQKAIGALASVEVACFYRAGLSSKTKKLLKALGDRLLPSLSSEVPYLQFADCWPFYFLAEIGVWSPKYKPDVLTRLLEIWKNSPLPDVQKAASMAISELPLIDRGLNPLPEPDSDSINFIKNQFLLDERYREPASLVIGFYWKKPWPDEELAKKIEDVETGMPGWHRNKEFILKALKSGKESAERKAHGAK